MDSLINIGIILTYVMVSLGAAVALYFGVMKIIQNAENAKKTIYTILGLLTICIMSYVVASDEVLSSFEKYDITSEVSKQVGMGLYVFYLLAFGGIASILFAEFSKAFKK